MLGIRWFALLVVGIAVVVLSRKDTCRCCLEDNVSGHLWDPAMTSFLLVDHFDETVNVTNNSSCCNGIIFKPVDELLGWRFHNLIDKFSNEILPEYGPFPLVVHVPLAVNCYRASGDATRKWFVCVPYNIFESLLVVHGRSGLGVGLVQNFHDR